MRSNFESPDWKCFKPFTKGARIKENLPYILFQHLIKNIDAFEISQILTLDLTDLQKKRLYIQHMSKFETKADISKNFNPELFSLKLDLETTRSLLVHFIQARASLFSRELLRTLMARIWNSDHLRFQHCML